jgi:peptidoglycan/LPS O-acetylase OafA/YrhL
MTETSTPPTQSVADTRLYCLDNLRVLLTAFVVLHHAALTYSDIPLWYYTEPGHDPSRFALDVFLVFNQSYFMGFFFLIAGFFTPGALDRKGVGRFVRERLVRLGIPLLIFVLVIRAVLGIPGAIASGQPYWLYYLVTWDAGPTWFLEVLLAFSLVYALVRRLRPQMRPRPRTALRGRWVAAFVVGLTVVTALWRLIVPSGTYVPLLGLPTPSYLPQYAAMFTVGVVAYRRGWLTTITRRAGRWAWVAVVAALAVLAPLGYVFTTGFAADVAIAAFEAVFAAGMILGLLVLFRDRFAGHGPRARFVAQNAFAVYVLHPLVLTALGYALAGVVAPAIVKALLLGALGLPLCWALAAAVRALPLARKVF